MARTKTDVNRAEHIIQAAEELFARYGYERTSIEDIAKHLGIGKGSVYLDFRTKEDILFTILERHAQFLMGRVKEKLDAKDRSALEILSEIFRENPGSCYERVTRDIHTPEALLHSSIQMKKRFSHYFIEKRQMLLMLLKRAAEQGEIPPENASEDVARALMQASCSLYPPYLDNYSEEMSMPPKEEFLRRGQILFDLLIKGLKS